MLYVSFVVIFYNYHTFEKKDELPSSEIVDENYLPGMYAIRELFGIFQGPPIR